MIVHEILSYELHFSTYFSTNEQQNQQILFNNDSCNQTYLNGVERLFHNGCDFGNLNIPQVSIILGNIYIEGKYVVRDVDKGIHYLTLAATQNQIDAQYVLGSIYFEWIFVQRNINKAIHYLTLAANHDPRDINKAIHYFKLSADKNDPNGNYNLGVIYYEGKYVKRDIDKSIQ